jgi:hypothetical protein
MRATPGFWLHRMRDDSPAGSLEVRPVAGALGATVTGIDLNKVTESGQLDEVRKALADHLVIFLPEQLMDLDDLERITDFIRLLGPEATNTPEDDLFLGVRHQVVG